MTEWLPWTDLNVHVSILFSQFVPPSPPLTMFKSLFSRSASVFIIIETPCLLTYIKLIEQFLTLFISNISIFVERVYNIFYEHQFSSVTQSCLTLCDPMNRSTPGLPVHHQLLEFTQNSRPSSWWCHLAISSSVIPFSSCPNPSQHQSLFQWVNSSHEVAKVLEFQL